MPVMKSISDLITNVEEVVEICYKEKEPIFITNNGDDGLVMMSIETYEEQKALLSFYSKVYEMKYNKNGDEEVEEFFEVARRLTEKTRVKI